MKRNPIIRIGHSSYKGANAPARAFSKAQAVRILRARGIKRDTARDAVNEVMRAKSRVTLSTRFDVIELGFIDSGTTLFI